MSLLSTFCPQTEFESYDNFADNFKINVPANFNFSYDVVDVIAAEEPDRRALVWCNDAGEERVFSFSDLKRESERVASYLKSKGIKRGDPVMVMLKARYEFWFYILALHRIGAICIPATHMLTTHDLVYRIKRADIKAIVSIHDNDLQGFVDEAQLETGNTLQIKISVGGDRKGWYWYNQEIDAHVADFRKPAGQDATSNEDISLLYFTSGTTGFPKMVQHNFTYPLGHILTARYWQNVRDGGLHYTVADSGWAKSVWGQIYGQWIAGSAVFVYDYDKFDAAKMLERIAKYKVTTFCAPPTIFRFLIREDLSQFDFSGLEYTVIAGEPLNPEVYEQFKKATALKLMEGYGQTELTVTIATYPWLEPRPGSMGKPSPGYDIDLLHHEGRPCEVGEEGEIIIRTDKRRPVGMFDGYYRDRERTSEVWCEGIYHTGDMAWKDEDGYYWFIGRADDVIKSSGYRIGPFEVESALMEHPAVVECAITAVPDEVRGQIVKATIVLAKQYQASEDLKTELQEHVKKVTAPYKYPRIIEFVDQLPKTISGKIRRVEIRSKDGQQ